MVTDQRSLRSAGARPRHCSQLTCRPSQQLPTYLHDQPIKGVYAYSVQTRRGGPVGIPGSKGRFFGMLSRQLYLDRSALCWWWSAPWLVQPHIRCLLAYRRKGKGAQPSGSVLALFGAEAGEIGGGLGYSIFY
ncbi:Putative protein of unknown function [Podospora comata]|uniref:Uncharacterized protein n=1 Tax=Podospora comata TaxID=48703 RepID=A0ABY6SJS9_PODCO|nr:Putative protein of unknown function [Podospora comata]